MNIINEFNNIPDFSDKKSIVIIGKLDGFHLGHMELIKTAHNIKTDDLRIILVSFMNSEASGTIPATRLYTRFEIENGIFDLDACILYECIFTDELRRMSAEEYISDIIVKKLNAGYIVAGEDFSFGYKRQGNIDFLKSLEDKYNFKCISIPKLMHGDKEISSTLIKELLISGQLEDANKLLGRPFSMLSTVVHGDAIGHKMGFPTINFNVPENKVLPPNGVYITKTVINGEEYISMTNVGNKPTFGDHIEKRVETHIFDFSKDVYGQLATVNFYKFLRPEMRFGSEDELIDMLKLNLHQTAEYFVDKND